MMEDRASKSEKGTPKKSMLCGGHGRIKTLVTGKILGTHFAKNQGKNIGFTGSAGAYLGCVLMRTQSALYAKHFNQWIFNQRNKKLAFLYHCMVL
jgi:hypothetical protein